MTQFCRHSPPQILGEAQWSWLERELQENSNDNNTVHIIVSSIQVLTTNPFVESWGHFPDELVRLLRLLNNNLSGVILLSGDVHYAEISSTMHAMTNHDDDHDDLEKRSLFEVTSSGLTHSCTGP